MSTSTNSPRQRPRTAIAELVRRDNRTKYLVYALDGTKPHDAFLNRLFRLVPPRGLTRSQVRDAVREAGRGRYRVYYNSVVVDPGSTGRRLFE